MVYPHNLAITFHTLCGRGFKPHISPIDPAETQQPVWIEFESMLEPAGRSAMMYLLNDWNT